MSSEESGDEGTVIVHPLTWRSNRCLRKSAKYVRATNHHKQSDK